ncbi:DUF2975 domain-containing protein [Flavobacterium sp. '19STA2R22 D10 B1']|uniref:DUF2975 domain-containing protein n=1 Tax=Flavobacterium aerium TaxID=3037261 RepID=UPI00278C19AD|nr:DUF2975 domain-containing protein [Flavobacterium sp. '19STA2R22 D10 B1']
MKNVRFIATILFYLSRCIALLYLTLFLYSGIIFFLSEFTDVTWNAINRVENNRFQILFPFSEESILLGDYTGLFITVMLTIFLIYWIFFWLLGNVFSVFRNKKLFTALSVQRLRQFYIANIIIPVLAISILYIGKEEKSLMVIITMLHFVIGIFAFFMASIFKQGLTLQDEQDLTI